MIIQKMREEFFNDINEKVIALQQYDKEIVDDISAAKAIYYIENMAIENTFDAFLFCSAINLLNTYVKQQKKIIILM